MKINNLTVKKNEKIILNNLNLTLEEGKTHIIMGPNGSGKTTLSYTLAGHPDCLVSNGYIEYKDKNLLELSIEERSLNGIYLAPQYPVVIEGLSHAAVLKESINIKRKFLNLNEIDEFDFLKLLKQKAQEYKFDPKDYIRHSFNSGYSGGEKKRNEMLQISLLNPDFIILDEIDSGLDIEMMDFIAQKIKEHQNQNKTILLITHYPDFANLINPDFVHILKNGSILTTGDKYLLEKIHQNGFGDFNV